MIRPLGIIAGASQTGKTSVVEYVQYLLGAPEYPDHEEMRENVTSAALEVSLNGEIYTIQRTTVGSPSKFASVWHSTLEGIGEALEARLQLEKPGAQDSLSYFLMDALGLAGARLQTSAGNPNADSHAFSFQDLSRLVFFENSRLDSKNLLVEGGNPVVAYKLQQTIDFAFRTSDEELGLATQRLRNAEAALREAEATSRALLAVVEKEYPLGSVGASILLEEASGARVSLVERIALSDRAEAATQNGLSGLRSRLNREQRAESDAWERVRLRTSLIERLRALALQYSDDKRKLTFLTEAEKAFDPLRVEVCPACLERLERDAEVVGGRCSLCGGHERADAVAGSMLSRRELRATTQRLDELTDYLGRLESELQLLKDRAEFNSLQVQSVASELDRAAALPAPFLAARDQLMRDLGVAEADVARAEVGVRLWTRVEEAERARDLKQGTVTRLRREQRELSARPDRRDVRNALSKRFAEILAEFDYPKLKGDAWLDDKLIPHVRGNGYVKASSGGLVLISLAWAMALWEISWERRALLPGLLVIDSPQKNLGHRASPDDADFADAKLVDNVYSHVARWLDGPGRGAQIIFVDNSPPAETSDRVVIRFSGNRNDPPFGLIDDAVD
ncbi:hypothetical protein [Microbacterium sp. Bi98]|uniref:hypothetical protein n=1 Tax=Microbacterium sp. Bi98 TaxID=2821116 RepID=UPI001E3164FE|nr:hypothetical protein [Microbacterium sp. Bi98]